MKLNVQQFIDQVMDGQFDQQSQSVVEGQLSAITGVEALGQSIQKNHLTQFEWQVSVSGSDEPVSVRLETSVINLPLANAKTITKIMDVTADAEVNVYMVCETPDLNRSGLRIDKLASATALVDDPQSVAQAAQQWIDDKITTVQANIAAAQEPEK